MTRTWTLLTAAALWAWPIAVHAHHGMGGRAPTAFDEGLFSGLAHPVINLHHFTFIAALGIFTAAAQLPRLKPIWFVLGTVAGCYVFASAGPLPHSGLLIAASLAVVGLALLLDRRALGWAVTPMFVLGGLLHGSAYAESIVGSDASSLHGYLLGFAVIQSVIAVSVAWGAYAVWRGDALYQNARLAGGITLGICLGTLWQSSVMAL